MALAGDEPDGAVIARVAQMAVQMVSSDTYLVETVGELGNRSSLANAALEKPTMRLSPHAVRAHDLHDRPGSVAVVE